VPNRFFRVAVLAAALATPVAAHAKLRVAASTTDLASIASTVGGDRVEVFAIARPGSDPHRVEALPSYMVKVSRAQLYLKIGLGLDQWAQAILDGSRNDKVKLVDCSAGVSVLEKPAGKVDASMGDVHPAGNPHYWLDPRNGAVVANNIAEALARADPANGARYRERAAAFAKDAEASWQKGRAAVAGMPSRTIVTYHRSWVYFASCFGLEVVNTVEPVPGIPPTAKHLAEVEQDIRARKVGVLLQEPYFSPDAGKMLGRDTGVKVITASGACDTEAAGSYLAHIESVVAAMTGGTAK
jgi:zinc/manganese transport system substrate-binding protein